MIFFKYQGAGNDFLIADNRDGAILLDTGTIRRLCDRHYGVGADGLMLLEDSQEYDFRMVYYNSDGSGGMMCGNGGRCIAAFAADLGFSSFDFEAADGFHTAQVLSSKGAEKKIRLKMKNVTDIRQENRKSWFIDTGTRHYVEFVEGLGGYNVKEAGREIRYRSEYAPTGVNANFAETKGGILHVRTYEKGVEDETFACGTGITAAAIAACLDRKALWEAGKDGRITIDVQALRDRLSVDFIPDTGTDGKTAFKDVWLSGPAVRVAEIRI